MTLTTRAVGMMLRSNDMRIDMTTILNGTEFVTAPAQTRRMVTVAPVRTGLAARRDARRNRRNTRAI